MDPELELRLQRIEAVLNLLAYEAKVPNTVIAILNGAEDENLHHLRLLKEKVDPTP